MQKYQPTMNKREYVLVETIDNKLYLVQKDNKILLFKKAKDAKKVADGIANCIVAPLTRYLKKIMGNVNYIYYE